MGTCEFAAIGWLITLMAVIYTNQKADNRETRKEVRGKVDQLADTLMLLNNTATEYYMDKNRSSSMQEIKIHESFNICIRIIENLYLADKSIGIQENFDNLFELITSGDFESKNLIPGEHNKDLCKDFVLEKEKLIRNLEQWFSKKFQK
ncbi:MAG: hypothetical protein K9L22_09150 [Methylococcaceae bacterium]|nr:hypothetical protein [Methylococcaceae bacterium]